MFFGQNITGDFLRYNIKAFFKTIFITLLTILLFVGVGFAVLTPQVTTVEEKVEKVPYYQSVPENASVIFTVLENKYLFYLDFENESIKVLSHIVDIEDNSYYGYSVDFYVECDLNTVSGIIDILGGIELSMTEEELNYTGMQVKEILERNTDLEIERQVIQTALKKIASKGFGKEDFLYIITNSKTNLTVPDCYDWENYIAKLCKNAVFVN